MTDGSIFCNQCGGRNSTTAQFCAHCGSPLTTTMPVPASPTSTSPVLGGQFQSQTLAVPMAQPATRPARYGGFWIRFVAVVIDGIIVQAVVMPVVFVAGLLTTAIGTAVNSVGQSFTAIPIILGGVFAIFASWIYEAAMESSSRQATLGKMIFGMKVTDLLGNRISFARATARHFSKYLSGMILMIGYIMAGFTPQKQALHDMIAGTVVRRP